MVDIFNHSACFTVATNFLCGTKLKLQMGSDTALKLSNENIVTFKYDLSMLTLPTSDLVVLTRRHVGELLESLACDLSAL